jgi:hypothetical protein
MSPSQNTTVSLTNPEQQGADDLHHRSFGNQSLRRVDLLASFKNIYAQNL